MVNGFVEQEYELNMLEDPPEVEVVEVAVGEMVANVIHVDVLVIPVANVEAVVAVAEEGDQGRDQGQGVQIGDEEEDHLHDLVADLGKDHQGGIVPLQGIEKETTLAIDVHTQKRDHAPSPRRKNTLLHLNENPEKDLQMITPRQKEGHHLGHVADQGLVLLPMMNLRNWSKMKTRIAMITDLHSKM